MSFHFALYYLQPLLFKSLVTLYFSCSLSLIIIIQLSFCQAAFPIFLVTYLIREVCFKCLCNISNKLDAAAKQPKSYSGYWLWATQCVFLLWCSCSYWATEKYCKGDWFREKQNLSIKQSSPMTTTPWFCPWITDTVVVTKKDKEKLKNIIEGTEETENWLKWGVGSIREEITAEQKQLRLHGKL